MLGRYHALIGRSVTDFTVVRLRKGSLFFCSAKRLSGVHGRHARKCRGQSCHQHDAHRFCLQSLGLGSRSNFDFAIAIRSVTLCTLACGLTTSTMAKLPRRVIGAKSLLISMDRPATISSVSVDSAGTNS